MATQTLEFLIKAKNDADKEIKRLEKSVSSLQRELDKTDVSMKKLGNTSKKATTSMTSSFVKAQAIFMGVMVAARGLQGVLKDASAFEQSRISFETMLGSAEKAEKVLVELTDFAANTPFELSGVVQSSKKLLAYGIEAEKLTETLKFLGDVSLGNTDIFNRVTFAFGQVKTAGKLFGTELRQFTEAGIPLIAELAKNFGVAESEIRKMVEESKVGFKDVEKAMKTMSGEGGRFENLMQKQMGTVQGLWSNLIDILGIASRQMLGLSKTGEVLENGLFAKIRDGLKATVSFLEDNMEFIRDIFKDSFTSIISVGVVFGESIDKIWSGFMEGVVAITGDELDNSLTLWKSFGIGVSTIITTLSSSLNILSIGIGDILSGNALDEAIDRVSKLRKDSEKSGNMAGPIEHLKAVFQFSKQATKEMGDVNQNFKETITDIGATIIKEREKIADERSVAKTLKAFNKLGEGASGSLQGISKEFKNLVDDIDDDTDDVTDSLDDVIGATGKTSAETEKEFRKIIVSAIAVEDEYKELQQKAGEELETLKNKNDESVTKIRGKIDELKVSLNELEESFKIEVQDIDLSLGERVIEQRQKIKDLEEDILEADDSDKISKLTKQLRSEEEALSDFVNFNKDLEDEIAEAERRAGLTSFERFIEDQNARKAELTKAFDEKKAQIEEEITLQESNLSREQAVFEARRQEILETQKTVEDFRDTFISSFDAMAINAENRIEFINRKLESFKTLLEEAKEIGAGSIFGVESEAPPTVEPIEGVGGGSNLSSSITININEVPLGAGGEVDNTALGVIVNQALIRQLQLQKLESL